MRGLSQPARAACLAAALSAALCCSAGAVAPADPAQRAAVAVEELLRSARLWQSLGHPDEERGVLLKLLAVQPDEPRALFLLGELELRTGHAAAAQHALELLQAGAAGSAGRRRALLAELQAMQNVYTRDQARLAELRLVLRGGNRRRALALARELFPGGRPPGDLANEFAPVLASTPGGWQQVRAHLQQRLAREPSSADQFSLAQLLAQHDDTRAQALERFAALSRARDLDPDQVGEAWRAALDGSADDAAGLAQRQRYLARYPRDAGVRRDLARNERAVQRARDADEEAREQQSTDPGVQARLAGQRALDAGRLDEAQGPLERALALHPDDAEAIGLLGLLRFRQGRYDEATARLDEARAHEQAARPGRAARWRDLAQAARYWGGLQEARRLRDAGQLELAVQRVEAVRPLQPQQDEALHLLAELRSAQGHDDQAQALYERLLQQDPADARAWRGRLAYALRQGQVDAVLDEVQDLPARHGVAVADALDASALRAAIAKGGAGHPDTALRQLERGVALLPQEAWLRYDLAQAYLALHLPALARQVMQEGLALAPLDPSMRYATALVDAALDEQETALARLEPIPAAQQSEGMRSLAQRMRFERALRLAAAARAAGHGDEDAQGRAAALAESGDDDGRRLRVARADLAAEDPAAARAVLEPLRDPDRPLAADDRRTLARLLTDAEAPQAALEQADILAVQAAAPAEAGQGSEDLAQSLLLRARAHLAQHDRAAARADWAALEAQLAPEDVTHRVAAIEQMDHDRDTAHAWLAALLRAHPEDPQVLLEAARQAQRDGHYDLAMEYLLRVGRPGDGAAADEPDAVPLLVPRPTETAPAAADGAAPAHDWADLLGQLAQATHAEPGPLDAQQQARLQMQELEARRQPHLETAWLHTSRSASDGTSSLHGNEIPFVAWWPGGYDGHWFAQVDRVSMDAGTLPAPLSSAGQFGKLQALLPPAAGLAAPLDEQAQGVSLAGGWRSDNRRFDLGVVGLGFAVPNLVGSWRENRSWDDTDVSAELSRRVLTGSLLSYAGAVDPVSGTHWGGATDTALTLRAGRDLADHWSAAASLSAGVVTGRNLDSNFNVEARGVIDRDWVRRTDFRLNAGLSLSLWHYQSNESFYTFGQGGYYSPQRYVALGLPVEIEGRRGPWSYDARVVPSRSWTYEQNTPYYPNDAALQRLAGDPIHSAGPGGGLSGSLRADLEYRAAPHWTVGAWLDIDRSAYYAPTRAMLYVRYWFKAQEGPVPFPPHPVVPISLY